MVAALSPTSLPGLLIRACRALTWARLWVPALFLVSSGFPYPSHAQVTTTITPSGTIGTTITQSGTTYNITGGTRPGGGPNLFHSFGQFSIGAVDTARFNNTPATPTSNILSRVTGGNPSNIFGTIDTLTYPGATLWLINPAGVVFGPGATLNVAGSVNIATADYLRTTDGARYFADLNKVSTLSMTPVAAFGFLGPSPPTAVRVKGSNLAVPAGRTLSLVGGDRTFVDTSEAIPVPVPAGVTMAGGQLSASSGRVNVVSLGTVANAGIGGEVVFAGSGLTATVTPIGFSTMGAILLNQNAQVDTSGNPSGTIYMRGGQLTLAGSARIISATTNAAPLPGTASGIELNADAVTITGQAFISAFISSLAPGSGTGANINITATDSVIATGRSGIGNDNTIGAETFAAWNAGNITLSANRILLTDAAISASSRGAATGAAGVITLQGPTGLVADAVSLTGDTGLFTIADGNGEGGAIRILARDISLTSGVSLGSQTNGTGDAGPIELTAARSILLEDSVFIRTSATQGQGGEISLRAGSTITLTQAQLNSSVTGGSQPGGDIGLHAPALTIRNSSIEAETRGDGPAGSVTLEATTLLADQSIIASRSFGESAAGAAGQIIVQGLNGPGTLPSTVTLIDNTLTTTAEGTGEGGAITIGASSALTLTNTEIAAIVSNGGPSGDTGNITLTAPTITITGNSIKADTIGTRMAGSIELTGASLSLVDASLSTRSGFSAANPGNPLAGEGGSITIVASSALNLTRSTISAAVWNGIDAVGGQMANISLTAPAVTMSGGSITAATRGTRRAGTIEFNVAQLSLTGSASISSSSSGTGAAGSLRVQGSGGPGTLPTTVTLTDSFLSTSADATGEGGAITIGASSALNLTRSTISATVNNGVDVFMGQVGDIGLTAKTVTMVGGTVTAETTGTRRAGGIQLKGETLDLLQSTTVSSSSRGTGDAGSISLHGPGGSGTLATTVTLTDSSLRTAATSTGEGGSMSLGASSALNLTRATITASVNNGVDIPFVTSIGKVSLTAPTVTMTGGSITAETTGTRRAGTVALQDVGNLTLSGGAIISSRSTSAGAGAGNAGTVKITASSLNATGSTVTTSAQQAAGGDITISAGNLSLGPGSIISAESAGPGDAGNILLTSGNTILLNGGAITTTAAQASGGDITLTASYMTRLINSQITSSVQGGPATSGGNITLDPQFVILQNSQILAQAFQGAGGNISIVANVLLVDPNSVIDASSQLGVSGSVNIQAPIQNLSGALVPLRQPLIQVAMSGDRCAASPTGQLSSFVQAGRDGVPPEPGSFLSSPLSLEDLEATPPKPGQGAVRPPARLGQRLEPAAGFPVSASPAVLVAGCSSGGSTRLPQRSDLLTP